MLFLTILLVAILYMATTAVTQNDKYLLSFLVLIFLAADINLHDPELTLILYIVLGAIAFCKMVIDFSFTSRIKNIMSLFIFSIGLFAVSNALLINDKVIMWVSYGENITTIVVVIWILTLLDFIQIKYIRHFIFVNFLQKHKDKKDE